MGYAHQIRVIPLGLPPGTRFLPFAMPRVIKDGLTDFLREKENEKNERAKRWVHACGRKDFISVNQITKDTYICSLHFIDPIEENPDPVIATSSSVRKPRKRKMRQQEESENLPETFLIPDFEPKNQSPVSHGLSSSPWVSASDNANEFSDTVADE